MVCVLEEEVSKSIQLRGHFSLYFPIACRGINTQFLPGDVQRFSDCVIVNGNLIFNRITYDEFM